jgi:DNA-binding MarR family transcriptional regulator
MAFQGSLEELPLPDVIQLVAASGKTGKFSVSSRLGKGTIFLREGEIVHATAGQLAGEEAFYELATWQEGEFVFTPGDEAPDSTIGKSNTNLLMQAAQRIDEWKVLVSRVPSTRVIPVFAADGGSTNVSLSPDEWRVIRHIDSNRPIEDIAREMSTSAFEVSKIVFGLITSGLVELKEPSQDGRLDRLQKMTVQDLQAVAQTIHNRATTLLANHGGTTETEDAYQNSTREIAGGNGPAALLTQFRTAERAILAALGPSQAQAFVESIQRLIKNP